MHEYHKIKKPIVELLLNNGYRECTKDTETDYCGSMQCIYANGKSRFMLFWDGEEGFGGVEEYKGNGQWEMLKPIVPESGEDLFQKNISELLTNIQRLF
jgi:hypothetical protein